MLAFITGFLAGIVFTFIALIALTIYLIYDSEDERTARAARSYEKPTYTDEYEDDDDDP